MASADPVGLALPIAPGDVGAVDSSKESPSSPMSSGNDPPEVMNSSGSIKSGGKCSLSISDLRASVKLVIDSLMPSAPFARAP